MKTLGYYALLALWLMLMSSVSVKAQTGPAGVGGSSSNVLWLKADDLSAVGTGNPVTGSWADASGNSNSASQGTSSYQPTYKESGGISSVEFDGINDFFDNTYSYTARTVFIVYKVNSSTMQSSDLGQLWGDYPNHFHVAVDARGSNSNGYSFDGAPSTTNARYALNGAAYGSFYENTNAVPYTDDQWEAIAVEFNSNQTMSRQVIGSLYPQFTVGTHQYGGEIAEIITYNTTLNTTQQIIVNNYLSAKYGIALSANDKFAYDAGHGNELAGIGRVASGNEHTVAASGGLLELRSVSTMTDGDFMLFGHDGGSLGAWTTTEAPSAGVNMNRVSREWRFDKTGTVGDVVLSIDTAALPSKNAGYSQYVIWVDADGNFATGATRYILSYNAGKYETDSISIADGAYVTIGTLKPSISFTTTAKQGTEQIGSDTIWANLSLALNSTASVDYVISGGTATGAGTDYTLANGTLNFAAGSTTAFIELDITDDTDVESSETLQISLRNASGAVLGADSVFIYTIYDNDQLHTIEFGAAGSLNAEVDTTLQIPVAVDIAHPDSIIQVDYAVTGGTATSGPDYTLAAGTLSIPAGNTSGSIPLTIYADALDEFDETVIITLSNPVNANIGTQFQYTFTLKDFNFPPSVAFVAASGSEDETASTVNIEVELSEPSGKDITVYFSSTAGTATDGVDYSLLTNSVLIPAGDTTAQVTVSIVNDSDEEFSEDLTLNIDSADNALLGATTAFELTILASDVMGFTGPGGVGDETLNSVWLKADDITGVSNGATLTVTWLDASGNSFSASQGNGTYQPVYSTTAANGKPAVTFDGVNDFLDNAHSYDARTVFAVFRVETGKQDNTELAQVWGNYGEGAQVGPDPRSGANANGYSFDGNGSTSAKYVMNGGALSGSAFTNNNSDPWSYDQWELVTVEFSGTQSITRQVIGSLYPAFPVGNHQFGGSLAELIVFNDTLNTARRTIVENYLAAKYGLTISNDLFPYETTFGNDVAGVGSYNGTLNHLAAESAGVLEISGPDDLDAGEYLFVGHDGNTLTGYTTTGLPVTTGMSKLNRTWRLAETGDVGSVDFVIDTTALSAKPAGEDHYLLLVDYDGDFSAGTAIYPLTYSNGKYMVLNVEVQGGDHITIATASNFSASSGDFNNGATWVTGVVPVTGEVAIVTQGRSLTLSGDATVGSVVVSSGAQLNLGSSTLHVDAESIVQSGTFNAGIGTVMYERSGSQQISALDYYNLTITGSGTKTLNGNIVINGDLDIDAGTLDVGSGLNYTINLRGNWTDTTGDFEPRSGTVMFDGSSLQEVRAGGVPFNNVTVNNSGSGLVLYGLFEISNQLTLSNGVITTNNSRVYISNSSASSISGYSSSSFINGNLRRDMGTNTDTYAFPVGKGTTATDYHLAELINNNLIGVSYMDAKFKNLGNHNDAQMNVSDLWITYASINPTGVWELEPNSQPILGTYDIRLHIDNFSGLTDNEFAVLKRPVGSTTGADWSTGGGLLNILGGLGRLISDGFMLRTGLTSFSEFGAGQSGSALPIELISFTAEAMDDKVRLDWSTAIEINNELFVIERSVDGVNFEAVAEEAGAGNSSIQHDYVAWDNDPITGTSYYRLKQQDFDGKETYSDLQVVTIDGGDWTVSVFPNPVTNGQLNLLVSGPYDFAGMDDNVQVTITDMAGRTIYSESLGLGYGRISITLPDHLSGGQYLMQLTNKQWHEQSVLLVH